MMSVVRGILFFVVTDHGSQFYANSEMQRAMLSTGLKCFSNCKASGIFFAGVNHPQTDGKIEKWHDLYI